MNYSGIKLFFAFVKGPARSVIYTVLFYSLWIIVDRVLAATYPLTHFEGRQIGVATLEAFDVSARVQLFYGSVLIFICSVPFGLGLSYVIYRKFPGIIVGTESRLINYVSVGGLLLFLFKLFDIDVYETQELIYASHKLLALGLILRTFVFKGNHWKSETYLALFAWAFSLYFLIVDLNNFMGNVNNPDFYIWASVMAIILMLLMHLRLKGQSTAAQKNTTDKWIYILLPLLCLPLLSFLKDEIYLVLKGKGYVAMSPGLIFVILFALLLFWLLLRLAKSKTKQQFRPTIISLQYLPLLVFSLTAYASYSVFMDYYEEVFESGNVYLPLMEYQLFGVLAPLEKLNTHLLSDYFFGAIYTFFNGLNLSEVDLYDFLLEPISYTLYYYLIFYLSRNSLLSFFAVFVFPFAEAMMPSGYCLGILGLIAVLKVIQGQQKSRQYYFYFFILVFLILWRIDLAYVSFVAMPLVLVYYHVADSNFKIKWPVASKTMFMSFGFVVLILLALSLYRHINLFEKLQYFLHYARSAQSYGYNTVGWSNLPGYKMHYFVFPVLMAISLLALLFNYKSLNTSPAQTKAFAALLFIILFYFLNFNRGIIRHSLIEWTDTFTASFVYIILAALPFFFLKHWSQTNKALSFGLIGFMLVANYRVPDTKGLQSRFEKLIVKLKTTQNMDLSLVKSRVKNKATNAGAKYKPFIEFIHQQCKASETFIDFSNKGMFYFYTRKETPSWFYQNPLCVQDDYLQTHFIADLKKYQVPFLLFQELNNEGYDFVDQVPNVLRHYRMAEYFYDHYEPAVILGDYCVWKQKGRQLINQTDTIIRARPWADSLEKSKTPAWQIKTKANKKYYAKIVFTKGYENQAANLICDSEDTVNVDPPKIYRLSPNTVYIQFDFVKSHYRVRLNNEAKQIASVNIMACDYLPDELYQRSCSYHFRKLPAVWGKYDALANEEKTVKAWPRAAGDKKDTITINLPANIDRSGGALVVMMASNKGKDSQKVQMLFDKPGEAQCTAIDFDILPGEKPEKYSLRISSIYHWYQGIQRIKIVPPNSADVKIDNVSLVKAN